MVSKIFLRKFYDISQKLNNPRQNDGKTHRYLLRKKKQINGITAQCRIQCVQLPQHDRCKNNVKRTDTHSKRELESENKKYMKL